MSKTIQIVSLAAVLGCLQVGCSQKTATNSTLASGQKVYTFALIAKNQANPVFQAARTGAEDAARDLSQKLGVPIKVQWRTPNEDDAQKQVEFLEQVVLEGVDGVSLSCVIADTLTPAIDKAVAQGVPVMCFDSDAPRSKRFAFFGTDDFAAGKLIMSETAKELGPGKHVVGIPGGNQNAANIQNRINGALAEAKKYPGLTIKGPFYSKETPQDAAAKIEEVQIANPDIDGWAMIGSWALFTDALMKWEPGKVKIVAMDALPAELPYVRKGIVARLYAQQTYQWGYRSIEILADRVINKKDPATAVEYSPLPLVDKNNADEMEANWKKWLHE
ncbi:MAG TPA: substrate-binding domain-containing protein [Candidatus Acidoferrales bacterium]|nr:substrate-binding domain-containing protein [Candidatus Acidoferrales bacterium]